MALKERTRTAVFCRTESTPTESDAETKFPEQRNTKGTPNNSVPRSLLLETACREETEHCSPNTHKEKNEL
ncbi:hypothetical protein E2C01_039226 [Portunus trituberculatus]|uniref:Uncharacterized protein n=1 Tax=Portunus trituberculatus TaxID=210409 RepID=A0A5B7FM73_PORTR|nr:hypothetical protein [Portunus trituberculatus]